MCFCVFSSSEAERGILQVVSLVGSCRRREIQVERFENGRMSVNSCCVIMQAINSGNSNITITIISLCKTVMLEQLFLAYVSFELFRFSASFYSHLQIDLDL